MAKASSSGLSCVLPGGVDTVVACATGAGTGALALVRLSGPGAVDIGRAVCPSQGFDQPWRARLATILGPGGEPLDEGIVLFFAGPKSYTGEDTVEFIVHGSDAVVEGVVRRCEEAGARRAEPGEFTRRAVANGKMDLLQAEAIDDLVRADTSWQLRLAREQLLGGLSRRIDDLRGRLVALLADVEGSLDFVDQGIVVADGDLTDSMGACRGNIAELLETATVGERVREGVRVVIAGATNAGKSTLFNTLIKRERAIVTSHPGTTRDALEAMVHIGGIPVVFVDTAGIRESGDPVETEGVRRAREEVSGADIVLLMEAVDGLEGEVVLPADCTARVIRVGSKGDLGARGDRPSNELMVSCVTGEGIESLRARVREEATAPLRQLDGLVAINRRHETSLRVALAALDRAPGAPREIVAAELRSAVDALHELVGDIVDETVLDAVFERFCVGK